METPNQGVLATKKPLNLALAVYMRLVEERLNRWLPDRIKIFNGVPDYTFIKWVRDRSTDQSKIRFFECDFTSFDSSQDEVTAELERRVFAKLVPEFASSTLLEQYYLARKRWFAKGSNYSWLGNGSRCSGEPATLLGNTILNMVLISTCFTFNNVRYALFKVDDCIVACDSYMVHDFANSHEYLSKFKTKGKIGRTAVFASYIFNRTGFYLSLPRLGSKIASREYITVKKPDGSVVTAETSVSEYQKGSSAYLRLPQGSGGNHSSDR